MTFVGVWLVGHEEDSEHIWQRYLLMPVLEWTFEPLRWGKSIE